MRHLAAAFALALICACAGSYTNGNGVGPGADGNGIGNIGSDAGDGGNPDGGDGGPDAGPDAGCVYLALSGVSAIDDCVGSVQNGFADVAVADAGNGCAVSITLTTSTAFCSGTASHGTLDAFAGACGSMQCSSASLPGKILCNNSGSPCNIRIACDAGTCP